jgi:ketosteroid isomerase-like protein
MKLLLIALTSLAALSLAGRAPHAGVVEEIEAVLTDFHAAAAEGDAERYFAYLSPDSVFFGTDAAERWPYDEYVALLQPLFEQGVKIVNEPVEQNVFVADDGDMAWFDETLEKPKYGEMRATGVLRHTDEGWKIVQFHLTFPIPNEIVPDVVKLTRAAKKRR